MISIYFKRILLKFILGKRTYDYMRRTLQNYPNLSKSYDVDIISRKDGNERRCEADWIRELQLIVAYPDKYNVNKAWHTNYSENKTNIL